MGIKWVCTGKSEHAYQYQDDEGGMNTNTVIVIDFTAEIDENDASGYLNELWEAKPILTQSGVEAFVGLQVYPQGFTVYFDYRLTDLEGADVIEIGDSLFDVMQILSVTVGSDLTEGGSPK